VAQQHRNHREVHISRTPAIQLSRVPKVVQIGRALGSGRAVFMDGSRWILSEADLRLAAVTRISGTSGHAMLEAVPARSNFIDVSNRSRRAGTLQLVFCPTIMEAVREALLHLWKNRTWDPTRAADHKLLASNGSGYSAAVLVFGRRHDESFHALWQPASKKRQGTKSREVGRWLAASAMEN